MVIIQDYKTRLHLVFFLWSGWALAPWNTSLACTANPYCKLKRQKMNLNLLLLWLFQKSTVPFTEIVIWSWMAIQNKSVVKLNTLCINLYLGRNWILMEVSFMHLHTMCLEMFCRKYLAFIFLDATDNSKQQYISKLCSLGD